MTYSYQYMVTKTPRSLKMHNLYTVVNFEIIRTIKKKTFWIMALGFPLMMGVIFGIIFLSNKATDGAYEQLAKQSFSIEITDDSKLISTDLINGINATLQSGKQNGIDNVKNGKIDSYIYYPSDLTTNSVEVYGKNVDMFNNGRYDAIAKYLLSSSVRSSTSPQVSLILENKFTTKTTTYRDGQTYDPVKEMIIPGVFLVLFYLLIAFFGNQMLTSTTEEKENRVIEMILTTIEARTLIIGKIISLISLALFQSLIIIVPAFIGYLLFRDNLQLPSIDLTTLPVNWTRIGVAVVIFSSSFILFTGLLVLIGSSVPTAKEAGGFIGLVMMLIFGPLYALSLFISAPTSPLVIGLSIFPFTAPIPLLLRNAVGNLQQWEILVAVPILIITASIMIALSVRVFKYGALEYSRKLSLREVFAKR